MATRIKLNAEYAQTIRLPLNGTLYRLNVRWNRVAETWMMDVYDQGENLLQGGVVLAQSFDVMLTRHPDWPGRLAVEPPDGVEHPGDPGVTAWKDGWKLVYYEYAE